MNMYSGTLHLIKSKNPPVFATPMTIHYTERPKKGGLFLFGKTQWLMGCNLSEIRKISKFDGFIVIETRNSYYVLAEGKI